MDLESAIKILELHNIWRRDNTGEASAVNVRVLGEAIDFIVCEFKNLHLQNVSNPFLMKYCPTCEKVTKHRIVHNCMKCDPY